MRTGGAPILTRETVGLASRNQIGSLREQEEPGWGFGFLSGVLTDAERAGSPAHAGTLSWGGVYGHSWFHDPAAELTVVGLTNTALEGCMGSFPGEVQASIYASLPPD
jgi:CubicO group peptidase (beta-lactamase class C family)